MYRLSSRSFNLPQLLGLLMAYIPGSRYDSGRQPMRPLFHTSVTVPYAGEGEPEPRISADAVVHVWLDA